MSSQQQQDQEEPAGKSPPGNPREEHGAHDPVKIKYRLALVPATPEDLQALKHDLVANEQLRFNLYVTVFLQNLMDYEQGKRKDVSTLIIKEP